MIERNARERLLIVLEIIRNSTSALSVKEIIERVERSNPDWYRTNRRSIYKDLQSLSDAGWIKIFNGINNTKFARIEVRK